MRPVLGAAACRDRRSRPAHGPRAAGQSPLRRDQPVWRASAIYGEVYCARGDIENRSRSCSTADRPHSCCRFGRNQLRVLLTVDVLLQELRLCAGRAPARDVAPRPAAEATSSAPFAESSLHPLNAWRRIALALGPSTTPPPSRPPTLPGELSVLVCYLRPTAFIPAQTAKRTGNIGA